MGVDGELRFPLCWTSAPVVVMGFDSNKMTPYEQGIMDFLEKMSLMDIHELLNKEVDSESLELYLSEYLFLFPRFFMFFSVSLLISLFVCFGSTNDSHDWSGKEEVHGRAEGQESCGGVCY